MNYRKTKLVGLSLFSNIGVAEAMLSEINIEIAVANEIDKKRAQFYKNLYPKTNMICGDIRDDETYNAIISSSINSKVDFIIATPPCQGMSTIGNKDPLDARNYLIYDAIKIIDKIKPKYIILENIPQQLNTYIIVNNKKILIPNYIKQSLEEDYIIKESVVNMADYGVPQIRKRSIFLLSRKNTSRLFSFLNTNELSEHINLFKSIGGLPSIDPLIQGFSIEEQLQLFPSFLKKKEQGLLISKWHRPPTHKIRHVKSMMHTAEGKSAHLNDIFYPKNKDGSKVKGFKNTYRRQLWDRPAYTITTYNGAICSHDNVHPGRLIKSQKKILFSDARVFTVYELLILMSIPTSWNIPYWAHDSLIRHGIGEGLPPLVVNKLLSKLLNN